MVWSSCRTRSARSETATLRDGVAVFVLVETGIGACLMIEIDQRFSTTHADPFAGALAPASRKVPHGPYAWNSRLEQVRPDSAFWSSEMSIGVTWNPADSILVLVRGNDAGKMTVSPTARALAA